MMLKHIVFQVALLFMANIAFAQTSNITTEKYPPPDYAENRKIKSISTEDSLIIAIDRNYPPLTMLGPDGQATGLLVEIWKLWSQKTGLKVKFRPSTFNETISALRNGEAHIHSGLFQSEKRKKWMDFSQPIYEASTCLYYPLGVGDPSAMSDLSYQNIGAILGSYQEYYLKKNYPDVAVFVYKDAGEMMHGALNGEIRAFVAEEQMVLALQLRAGLLGKFEKIKNPLFINKIHAGVLKGNKKLLNLIDEGFNAISTDELIKIEGRYIQDSKKRYYRAQSSDINLTAQGIFWLAEPFRIITEEFPPYNHTEDGKISGISTGIVRELLKRIGHPDNMEVLPWSEGYNLAQTEDNVILFSTTRSPMREKLFKWVGPLVPNNTVFFARKGSGISIKTLDDAKLVKSIGVYKDDFAELLLKKKGFTNLDAVLGNKENVEKLINGKIDLWIANELTGKHLASEEGFGGKIEKVYEVQEDFMYMAFSKTTPDVVIENWQMILDKIKSDGTYAQILSNWIMFSYAPTMKSDSLELTEQEKAWLEEHKTIRLGVDPAFPPFEFIDKKGNYRGFGADYIEIISQRLGVEIKVVPGLSWSQVIEGVKKHEIDLLPVLKKTEKRSAFLDFTEPYLLFPEIIMTRKDYPLVNGLDDFSGKVMAAVKGYSFTDKIKDNYPEIKLHLVETPLEALKAVSFGKADGFVINFAVGTYLAQKNLLLNLKVGADMNLKATQGYRFGVRNDWPIFISILEKALDSISQAERNKIMEKWISVETLPQSGVVALDKGTAQWLIAISIVIFLVLSVSGFFVMKALREESLAQRFGTRQFRMLTLITLSIFITVVASLSWLALESIKGKMLKRTQNELEIVLNSTAQRLTNWFDSKKSFMDQLGRDPELVDITGSLLSILRDPDTLIPSAALQEARDFFKSNQERFGKIGFFIISPDRISIGSMRDDNMGTRNFIADRRPELIEQAFNGTAVFIPPTRSDVDLSEVYSERPSKKLNPPTMFFATPIRKQDGTVIAVLTQRLIPEQEFSRELHFGRMGETGETYAFDRNGLLISESRFNDHLREIGLIESNQNSVLNVEIRDPGGNMVEGYRPKTAILERPFTRMAASAIRGESGTDVDGYRDYRGVPVYGSWKWIKPLGFGLTTEIDVKEALSTFNTMRLTTFSILGVTLFLSIGATLFTLALGERANLSLARARDELEQRVEERTNDLAESKERFELTVAGSGDGLWEYDFIKKESWFSPRFKEMLGYQDDELANTFEAWKVLLHPDDLEKANAVFLTHLKSNVPYDIEYQLRTKAGEYRWFHARGKSLRNEQGRVYRTSGSVTDVTEQKQNEEELRKLSTAVEQSPATVVITDVEGNIEYVNPKFTETTGYTKEEALGKNPRILKSDNVPPGFYKEMWETIIAGDEWRGEFQNKKKNGDLYWEQSSISPIRDSSGIITHFLAVKEDITERKKRDEEFRALLDSAPDATIITNSDGEIVMVNKQTENIFEYEREELIGNKIEMLIPQKFRKGHPKHRKKLIRHSDARLMGENMELLALCKDGREFPVEIRLSPIKTSSGTVVASSIRDITERKKAENELKVAKQAAEEATQAKSDFLANMSHEIRTPMNAIIGMSQLALRTELTPKQHDYLVKVEYSAHNLLGIINDILDFSKIEAGKMDIELIDFHLDGVLENLSNLVTLKAEEKGLEVIFSTAKEVPMSLVGDPLRLGQILINLSNNAVKFTEKGEVVVSTEVLEKNTDNVTLKFTVRDTGIGLTEKQIGKLFQSFSQADGSTTRKYGGTGLGLTISKKLVEMMDGEIWVESEHGKGSSFIFTAKLGRQAQEKEKVLIPSVDLRGMRVLVVDDCDTSRETLQVALESMSFKVTTVASGKEAIAELERCAGDAPEKHYQLVLMDWKMPKMNGIETTSRIKADPKLPKAPTVIMVTAYGREEVMKQADAVGMDGFLIKPVSNSTLFDTIMEVFGKSVERKSRSETHGLTHAKGLERIRGAKILLAEDNEINQQVATELLEQAGMVVTVANNGREAVEKVNEFEFDLVFMDVQMPEMNGLEATAAIRKIPKFKDLPIVAMTAQAMAGDREECLEAGMDDYVTKPIDTKELFSALVKWIEPGEREVVIKEVSPDTAGKTVDMAVPELEGIDTKAGLQRIGGSEKLYKDLLIKFHDSNVGVIDEIKKAFGNGEYDEIRGTAHSIKGVAGLISANDLFESARDLEESIRQNKMDGLESKMETFNKDLKLVLDSIETLTEADDSVQTDGGGGDEVVDKSKVEPILRKLAALLDEDDMDALELMGNLKELLKASSALTDLKKLEGFIGKYDFEGALEVLSVIAKSLSIQLKGDENG